MNDDNLQFNDDDINDELLNSSGEQYFYFLSNNIVYAIEALSVKEIIEYQDITKAPLLNSFVLGITNVRGSIVTVVDLFDRFEGQSATINSKSSFVIVNTLQDDNSYNIAILVDEILEVDGLDEGSQTDVPNFGTKIKAEFMKEIARYDDKEVYILNIDKVLDISQLNCLDLSKKSDDDSLYTREIKRKKYTIEDDWDDEESDDIDIVELVSTNSNDTNQYLIFQGPKKQYYAKNISKIEELIFIENIKLQENLDNNIISGTANIRGEMLTLVNFDKWLGVKKINNDNYEEIIIVKIAHHKFGLIVQNTKHVVTIDTKDMNRSDDSDSKSTFIANIMLDGCEVLCTIVDSDKIILDVFESEAKQSKDDLKNIKEKLNSKKQILFADDSSFIRNMLNKTAKKLKAKYKIYEDGALLYSKLQKSEPNDIGLIVTDIEMPKMNGKELIETIRADEKYNDIPIIVYTNMANPILEQELIRLGASKVVSKIDVENLSNAIIKYMG